MHTKEQLRIAVEKVNRLTSRYAETRDMVRQEVNARTGAASQAGLALTAMKRENDGLKQEICALRGQMEHRNTSQDKKDEAMLRSMDQMAG